MGCLKKTIEETRDWATHMRNSSKSSPWDYAQYSCQVWNLNQILKAIEIFEKIRNDANFKAHRDKTR